MTDNWLLLSFTVAVAGIKLETQLKQKIVFVKLIRYALMLLLWTAGIQHINYLLVNNY